MTMKTNPLLVLGGSRKNEENDVDKIMLKRRQGKTSKLTTTKTAMPFVLKDLNKQFLSPQTTPATVALRFE